MTIENVKYLIKHQILNSISARGLSTLCSIFKIPVSERRKQNETKLLSSITASTDITLLNEILFILNKSVNRNEGNETMIPQARYAQSAHTNHSVGVALALNVRLYCLSKEMIDCSPIDLRSELIHGVDMQNIFVPNFTKYPHGYFNAPSCAPSLINGRMSVPNTQLPYTSTNTTIKPSPFYCCQVVMHPLSLLIPKPTPNICQPNRIMSKMQLSFTLSPSVRQLITAHRSQINNKPIYKWQVLLRLGVYDPVRPFPTSIDEIGSLPEYIPPYLSLSVNNATVSLWEILPSNHTAKEGKRHSRPINITDHVKYSLADDQGYRQIINVNWWQTPGVYLYYYAAVFLERKLDVNELLNQFVKKTHQVQRPKSFTLNFIREKFSANNQFSTKTDDDDLIISSVLPISLHCPVGKSRITCPLRSINCQHIQCFDAQLYLMMNERRSVWKCPVCDGQATLNELFLDEYFNEILINFENDDDISEVNVNPDGTYVPVAVKESRENKQHLGNIISNLERPPEFDKTACSSSNDNSTEIQPVILVESDEDVPSAVNNVSYHPSAMVPFSSTIKVTECTSVNTPLHPVKSACTIDLTSDSEDDARILQQNDLSSAIPQPFTLSPKTSATPQCASQSSQNRINVSNILPKMHPNLTEAIHSPTTRNDNYSVVQNHIQKYAMNTRLLLPGHKLQPPISNTILYQDQNYSYIFPKTYISKPMLQNHNAPFQTNPMLTNQLRPNKPPSYLPTVNKPTANISNPFIPSKQMFNSILWPNIAPITDRVPAVPKLTKVDTYNNGYIYNRPQLHNSHGNRQMKLTPPKPIKVDTYNNDETSAPSSGDRSQSITSQKSRSKKVSKPLRQRPPGSRRSTRLLRQNKKRYLESSSDGEDKPDSDFSMDELKLKRENPFNDTESSSSSSSHCSNKKLRRLLLDRSSEDELVANDVTNDLSIQEDVSDLKYPIICLTRLEQDDLVSHLQHGDDDAIDSPADVPCSPVEPQ